MVKESKIREIKEELDISDKTIDKLSEGDIRRLINDETYYYTSFKKIVKIMDKYDIENKKMARVLVNNQGGTVEGEKYGKNRVKRIKLLLEHEIPLSEAEKFSKKYTKKDLQRALKKRDQTEVNSLEKILEEYEEITDKNSSNKNKNNSSSESNLGKTAGIVICCGLIILLIVAGIPLNFLGSPELQVKTINLKRDTVGIDKKVGIDVIVQNLGGRGGSKEIKVNIGNNTETRKVKLEPEQYETLSFEFIPEEPGDYVISAMSKSEILNVVKSNTIVVDKDGTEDYTSIKTAINHATSADTIIVNSGIYRESISIWEKGTAGITGITLKGNNTGDGKPIIEYKYTGGTVISISSNYTTVKNFIIRGGKYDSGREGGIVITSHYNTIKNNTLEYNNNGISISRFGGNNKIIDNRIHNNENMGIEVEGSDNNEIIGNIITENRFNGININDHFNEDYGGSNNNKIVGNKVRYNGNFGIKIKRSHNNLIYFNSFRDNNDVGYEQVWQEGDCRNNWYSPEPIEYIYKGKRHTSRLGNYHGYGPNLWEDADADGVEETETLLGGDYEGEQWSKNQLMAPIRMYNIIGTKS